MATSISALPATFTGVTTPGSRNAARINGNVEVDLRQYPRRGALVDLEGLGLGRQCRRDLHATGSGADDRDPLAAGLVAAVPRVRPENGADEVLDAVDVDGVLGVDVAADGADHELRGDAGPAADGQPPHADGVIPSLLNDFGIRLQPVVEAQLRRGVT
jgi:hypothetical protein